MQSLYRNGLEHIYDAMYQTFIDYQEEFEFYNGILDSYHTKSVAELGCGTGNLAKYFIQSSKGYIGIDLSGEMISLAQKRNPDGSFLRSDIKNFRLSTEYDAAIVTGRTTSYLLKNEHLNRALPNIHKNLTSNGLLIFDFIDAERFFRIIGNGLEVQHNCYFEGVNYRRDSHFKVNKFHDNLMFDWKAKYYKIVDDQKILIAEDDSTVRAFTREEWSLFLNLNDYEVLSCLDRKSYAFDTYVMVAKRHP